MPHQPAELEEEVGDKGSQLLGVEVGEEEQQNQGEGGKMEEKEVVVSLERQIQQAAVGMGLPSVGVEVGEQEEQSRVWGQVGSQEVELVVGGSD